ncbi:MAG TPA: hypothetical protein VE990_14965 [Acidimicrobiales bacterium]|nr:hypothetical protein [Acidimicrobiales bacterium]
MFEVEGALVSLTEIGRMLGVSRQRAAQLAAEYDDFPQPAAMVGSRRIWSEAAVTEWAKRHPDRRPGRPIQGKGPSGTDRDERAVKRPPRKGD